MINATQQTDVRAAPSVMPVDREAWFRQLNASNFANAFHEYDDLQTFKDARRILIVGPGQGLDVQILRWRGYEVQTLDIDETFKPDFIGSVHDLSMFENEQFDVVIASHVLEHVPLSYLHGSLAELARIARYALVYLPVAGRHFQFRLKGDIKGFDRSIIFDFFSRFHKPDGETPRYCAGQHYWEIGYRGFKAKDMRARFSAYFEVIAEYRNVDWNPSYNFILKARRTA